MIVAVWGGGGRYEMEIYAATSSLAASPLVSASFSAAIFAFFSGIESAISAAGVSSATSFTFLLTASAGASKMKIHYLIIKQNKEAQNKTR